MLFTETATLPISYRNEEAHSLDTLCLIQVELWNKGFYMAFINLTNVDNVMFVYVIRERNRALVYYL